eukprot:COSAG06_NODE_44018_length_367_cov_0.548507_1_plen_67_part_10
MTDGYNTVEPVLPFGYGRSFTRFNLSLVAAPAPTAAPIAPSAAEATTRGGSVVLTTAAVADAFDAYY